VISALVGFLLLLAILFAGSTYLLVGFFVIAMIGIQELFHAFRGKGFKPLFGIGILWVFLLFLFLEVEGVYTVIDSSLRPQAISVAIFLTLLGSLLLMVLKSKEINILDITITIFGVIYVGYLFTFIPATRFLPQGEYLVWIIFIGAWLTDTFAYFTGVKFGKRKIIPEVSPKKTVEGFIGGAVGCSLSILLFGIYMNQTGVLDVHTIHFLMIGIICGVLAQIGDWSASAIKRYTGVKDFGTIMPGHGGVLDRFDSILMIAPFVYHYLIWVL
jgi:phosphatidate cytidylyltransferase